MRSWLVLWLALSALAAAPALAAPCGGTFETFIGAFKREAAAQGVSQRTLASALADVTDDPRVLALDRGQRRTFQQSFEQFGLPRVAARLAKGTRLMQQHAALLSRIEQRFGVPGAVVIAIWGLETDFGADSGRLSVIRSVATLAHDCRRSERFQSELLAALQILDRGDITSAEMRGDWAGEMGQTQFLPSSYLKFAVDFDGDGRRDLIRSVPDALASTANYLKGYGWQRGAPWSPGSANFDVLLQWNKSQVYSQTVAYFASKLAGKS
jgi:lytic murein transglycosylase